MMSATTEASNEPESAPGQISTRVLVVDDEAAACHSLGGMLLGRGFEVATAEDGAKALEIMAQESVDVALLELTRRKVGGLELLERVKRRHPDVEIIMVTAYGDVETAVRAVRLGAYHFLTKPFRSNDEVVLTVTKAAERRRLIGRAAMLERQLGQKDKFGELIGNSPLIREVYRLALGVAATTSTVLLVGESGTGKELTARAIHDQSPRARGPFIAVNCSAIPEELVEGELFGACTGETPRAHGLFDAASGGTILLDEVGSLPLSAQVKLSRVLQEGEIKCVGSNGARRLDARVIAATDVDLRAGVSEGIFREELSYRLNVVSIELPPLRKRRDDIPLLAYHFLNKYASRVSHPVRKISPEALSVLTEQPWPGNVRELENAIEHAVVFCQTDTITPGDLPFWKDSGAALRHSTCPHATSLVLPPTLVDLPYREAKERAVSAFDNVYFSAVLRRTGGNVSEAARQAGLDRSNFRRAAKRAGTPTRT